MQAALLRVFGRYGLPKCINTDNGAPWGNGGQGPLTRLGVWLIRLGIHVSHSRPHHRQTNGKDERFHRTLKAEVIDRYDFIDLQGGDVWFDPSEGWAETGWKACGYWLFGFFTFSAIDV